MACQHCAEILGGPDPDGTLALAVYEGAPAEAGPQIMANPADYVDEPVVFRQYCWTALHSAVVPASHPGPVTALGW